MKKYIKLFFCFLTLIFGFNCGCKKAYNPRIVSSANNYLVVEAVINTGADSTIIKLSRTVPISSAKSAVPETGAVMSIVSDANVIYPVVEKGNGVYMGAIINSNSQAKYSLKIFTKDGKNYQSDFVSSKNSPPIDSVYYKIQSNGLSIYADTHDPSQNSRYYRWDFVETYIFSSAYNSYGIASKVPIDTVLYRPLADQIYQCWRTDTSTSIILNSSAKLTNDVIAGNSITSILSTSEKIARRYSILVNQYALTTDAYNYYQQLKKNTESLGTIFDPQPSELPGNIHCLTNPSEVVIGFITAGTPSKTRIYINNDKLPNWVADNPYAGCVLDTFYYKLPLKFGGFENQVAESIVSGLYIPVLPISFPGSPPVAWSASIPFCVDCTLRGTNIRPAWWMDESF